MRASILAAAMWLLLAGPSTAADLKASVRRTTHIAAQGLGAALQQLARDRGFQILYRTEVVGDARTAGAVGELTAIEALTQLLSGTGLTFIFVDDATVSIVPQSPSAANGRTSWGFPDNRSFLQRLAPDQAETSQAAGGERSAASGSVPMNSLEEVIVTAQKREQRLQDVPVPVSVVNTDDLAQNNQTRLQDFASSVPGLSVMSVGNGGTSSVSIRGIDSGAYTPATVAVTLDDVPSYGGLASVFSPVRPDFDPSDIGRIEVLRGPQGTLYGASSMGGLINYVTVDPSTRALSGRMEAGADRIHDGNEPGYNVRGSVNIPLSEAFAMRASGFTRRDTGYIDNPVLGKKGINEGHVSGGRLSALWRPFDTMSVKLGALYQHAMGDNQNEVQVPTAGFPATAGLVGLQQNSIPGTAPYDQKYQNYSAVVKAEFGTVNLVSISAYGNTKWNSSRDLSWAYGPFALPVFGVSSVGLFNSGSVSKFSEEFRVTMPIGPRLEWLAGAFYTHENFPTHQEITVLDPVTGRAIGSVGFTDTPKTYVEYAVFTDLTIHFTNRFNVQLGGRESSIQIEQRGPESVGGIIFGNVTTSSQQPTATTDVFTYLLTPQYMVSANLMLYGRLASGFRSGQGFNISHLTNPAIPEVQNPDKTQNYEIGAKGTLLDRLLSFDASLYYIDWKEIQLTLIDSNSLSYGTNGARAKSEGVELSIEATPLKRLTVSAWATYSNAVLTKGLGADSTAYGPAGSRLPYSSRYSGNIALKQVFSISNRVSGFAQGSLAYVGQKIGNFLSTNASRQVYPGYVRMDINGGLKTDQWTANLYVNNLTDKRGLIGGGVGTAPAFGYYYVQPRTIGFSLSRRF